MFDLRARSWVGAALISLACTIPCAVQAQDEEEWEEEYEEEYEEEEESDADTDADSDSDTDSDSDSDADTASEDDEDEPEEDLVPAEEPEARRFRAHNSILGSTGGMHLADAGTGALGTFRLQLALEFFATSDYLVENDTHSHVGGVLSLGWSPLPWLEAYGHIHSWSNSNDRQHPQLLSVLGDTALGVKAFTSLMPWLRVGGELVAAFPTGHALGPGTLDVHLRALATADLRELPSPVPVIARLNLRYRFDNSALLVEDVEDGRYAALPDPRPREDETRHLITRVERFGLGINRADFFDIGIGAEAPFRAGTDLWIHPLLEWNLGLPVVRRPFDCVIVRESGADRCLDREGLAAMPMSLTIGVRVLPPVKGLSTFLAIDLGLSGTSRDDAVTELAQNPPYMVRFGAGYAFQIQPPPPEPEVEIRRVDRRVEVRDPVPPRGRLVGWVQERGSLQPIDGAVVTYRGHDVNAQSTSPNGRFESYRFPPGEVTVDVTHPQYEDVSCSGTIGPEGGDVETRCEMTRRLVIVEESEIQILEQIQFGFDRADILPESFPLMESIARTVRDSPQIRRIEIQGHTDDQGSDQYNLSLSQRRADSVKQWLVQNGVDANRLMARGYGESQPLINETTDAARATNRRVQFIILERDDGATQAVQPGADGTPPPAPAPDAAPAPAPDAPPAAPPP